MMKSKKVFMVACLVELKRSLFFWSSSVRPDYFVQVTLREISVIKLRGKAK